MSWQHYHGIETVVVTNCAFGDGELKFRSVIRWFYEKKNNHKNCLWQASGRRQLSASCYVWLAPACKSWQDHRVNKADQRWNCIFCLDEWPAEGAGTLIVSFPWAEKGRFGRRSGRALLCPTFLGFFFSSFLPLFFWFSIEDRWTRSAKTSTSHLQQHDSWSRECLSLPHTHHLGVKSGLLMMLESRPLEHVV